MLTGGEPLLQQDELTELIPLIHGLKFVEIETNGTKLPSTILDSLVTAYNVSPKLSNSGMDESLRLKADSLDFFAHSPKAIFKFVIQDENDLTEVQNLQDQLKIPSDRIYLMPEGRTPNLLNTRSQWLANICITNSYIFTPRLHIFLWGNQRAK